MCVCVSVEYRRPNCWTDHDQIWHAYADRPGNTCLGMVPTKYWPNEWPGIVGSLGPISESGLSCQLLLRAVVWQMTSQLIRRRNDVVFAAFNQPVSVRPMNVQTINKTNVYPPHPGGPASWGGWGVKISKVREVSRTAEKIDKKKFCRKNNQNM